MKIPLENLHARNESERLYNITYECQKQRTSDITVKELYEILNEIKAHYAAEGLLREAFLMCEQRSRTSSDVLHYRKPELNYSMQCANNRLSVPWDIDQVTYYDK